MRPSSPHGRHVLVDILGKCVGEPQQCPQLPGTPSSSYAIYFQLGYIGHSCRWQQQQQQQETARQTGSSPSGSALWERNPRSAGGDGATCLSAIPATMSCREINCCTCAAGPLLGARRPLTVVSACDRFVGSAVNPTECICQHSCVRHRVARASCPRPHLAQRQTGSSPPPNAVPQRIGRSHSHSESSKTARPLPSYHDPSCSGPPSV